MTEQSSQEETSASKSSSSFWARLGIFFTTLGIIIFLAAFAFAYFQLSQLAKSMQTKDSSSQQSLIDLQTKVALMQQSLEKTEDLSAQQEKLMTEWKAAQSGDLNAWHIAQAQYLIKMANDQIQFAANSKVALELLQQADKELQTSENPDLVEIRKSLASDISNLQALPQVDVTSVFVQINTINQLLDKLPLPTQPLSTEEQGKAPQASKWKGALDAAWQGLNKIVIVRKVDSNALPLVLPEEKIFLYQNLHAQMENSIWGLLHQNKTVFDNSLANAKAWVEQYFVQDAIETKNILRQLEELQKVDVTAPSLTFGASLQLLDAYLAKIKGAQKA